MNSNVYRVNVVKSYHSSLQVYCVYSMLGDSVYFHYFHMKSFTLRKGSSKKSGSSHKWLEMPGLVQAAGIKEPTLSIVSLIISNVVPVFIKLLNCIKRIKPFAYHLFYRDTSFHVIHFLIQLSLYFWTQIDFFLRFYFQ